MKIRKIAAIAAAAAVLAVAAPMTGVLPVLPSSVASAAEFKEGDSFWAGINKEGNLNGKFAVGDLYGGKFDQESGMEYGAIDELYAPDENDSHNLSDAYSCTVKADGTISVSYTLLPASFYKLHGKTLTIPSEINGYKVSEIVKGEWGKAGCKKLVIPETVKVINQGTFTYSFFLEEVEFNGNSQLELIDQWAFQDCRSLKSITIPASVETIAYAAFCNSEQQFDVGTITIGDGEDHFDFTDTYSLTTVNFAEGSKLRTLGDYAFQAQAALESITLPDSLETIGQGAFLSCISLTKLDIPANVNKIGNSAFGIAREEMYDKTSKLTEVNVSENNKNYKDIDGVVYTKDGKTLVGYPAGKTEAKFAEGVTEIQAGAFQGCNQITSVTIPDTITKLPVDAFAFCTKLKDVTLPETLTEIGAFALQSTAIADITIPESVTAIDPKAFSASSLKNINGKSGSYAETYAKENGYTFNSTSSDTFTDESSDKAADVQVIAKPNVIPKEAHFSVRLDSEKTTDEIVAYNCYFTYNGAEYEPTETVTVKIPVPVAMRDIADTLKVYHLQDGKYVNMSAKVEDGYLVFDTDHFSVYVVTAKDLEKENTGDESSSETSSDSETSDNESSANSESSGDSGSGSGSDSPDTGFAGISLTLGVIALAGAAVLVAHKRK